MAAPVFMACMGIGLAYSRNSDPRRIVKRGIKILIVAYILNIIRALLYVIEVCNKGTLYENLEEITILFLEGDILHFAGLALILFGIVKLFNLKDKAILAIGIVFSFVATLHTVIAPNIFSSATLGLFVATTYEGLMISEFPLVCWFIFVAFGFWFGNRLKCVKELDKFYLKWGLPCFIISFLGISYEYRHGINMMNHDPALNNFYSMVPHDALLCICFFIFLLALFHFAAKALTKWVRDLAVSTSNALNLIFIIHWIIISCICIFWAGTPNATAYLLLISMFVFVISSWLGIKLKKKKISL